MHSVGQAVVMYEGAWLGRGSVCGIGVSLTASLLRERGKIERRVDEGDCHDSSFLGDGSVHWSRD